MTSAMTVVHGPESYQKKNMANSRRVPNATLKAGILLQKSQYMLSFNDYEKLLLQMVGLRNLDLPFFLTFCTL